MNRVVTSPVDVGVGVWLVVVAVTVWVRVVLVVGGVWQSVLTLSRKAYGYPGLPRWIRGIGAAHCRMSVGEPARCSPRWWLLAQQPGGVWTLGEFSPCGFSSSWASLVDFPLTIGRRTTAPSVPGRGVAVGRAATCAEFSRDATQNNTAIMEMNANTAITPIKYKPASGPRPNRSACGFVVDSPDGG